MTVVAPTTALSPRVPNAAPARFTEPVTQQLPALLGEPVPGIVLDVDVAGAIPSVPASRAGRRVATAWVLVRAFTEPLGQSIVDIPRSGLTAAALAARVERDFGPAIRSRVRAAGGDPTQGVPVDGIHIGQTPAYLVARAAVLADPSPITVVVCTRERPVRLRACLESLVGQAYPYPAYRILVVDNAPRTDATRDVVREFQRRFHVDYLVEPRLGRSRARNAAVAAAPGEILAFTDDDVVADRFWLAELARGFAEVPTADVVSGLDLPAELETPAQVWFELLAGQHPGRGFTPTVFTRPERAPGLAGAAMAFRPGVVEALGGFDVALGAGTPARGAEETLALLQVLHSGGSVAYRPAALARRVHPRDLAGVRTRLFGCGTGHLAAYTALVCRNPRVIRELIRRLPAAFGERSAGAPAQAGIDGTYPAELLSQYHRGALRGPAAYLRGRLANRRADRHCQR